MSQVVPEVAEHLLGIPPHVEMFFNPTGQEAEIQPIGRDFGEVVYNYEAKCDFSFYCKYGDEPLNGFSPPELKNPIPRRIEPDSLLFESRFESGNLAKAVRITDTYYELHLRPDLYTDRHCQWFYFRYMCSLFYYLKWPCTTAIVIGNSTLHCFTYMWS